MDKMVPKCFHALTPSGERLARFLIARGIILTRPFLNIARSASIDSSAEVAGV